MTVMYTMCLNDWGTSNAPLCSEGYFSHMFDRHRVKRHRSAVPLRQLAVTLSHLGVCGTWGRPEHAGHVILLFEARQSRVS